MIWFDLRYDVARSSAASFASVPEVVKNTLASGIPDISVTISANSIMGSLRYSVELWRILAAWS